MDPEGVSGRWHPVHEGLIARYIGVVWGPWRHLEDINRREN